MTDDAAHTLVISPRFTTGVLGRALDSIPPAVGAEVMGTAIISIALSLDGQETLSRVTLAIAALIWVMLAVLLPLRAARDPARFRADVRTPTAFTAGVATAVLGTRLTLLGWAWAGVAHQPGNASGDAENRVVALSCRILQLIASLLKDSPQP